MDHARQILSGCALLLVVPLLFVLAVISDITGIRIVTR